jgi:hypothetical protein
LTKKQLYFRQLLQFLQVQFTKEVDCTSPDPWSDEQPDRTSQQEAQDVPVAQEQDPADPARRFLDPDRDRNFGQLNRFKPQGSRLAPIIRDRQPP